MDKLSTKNEQKLHSAIQLIDKVVVNGNSALGKFPTGNYDLIVFYFINYLERFTSNLNSINILLKHYKNNPNVETSIGLIIRANLLDFMTITYLSTYMFDIKSKEDKEGENKYNKQFESLLSDQIYNTLKYLKHAKASGLITQDNYKVALEKTCNSYNFLFTDGIVDYLNPEKKLKSQDFISPKQLFTRIHNHTLTKKFSKVYDLYSYYGKYEHFGIMTHFIQRQGLDIDFETMIASMKYIIRGIGASLKYLNYPINKLNEEQEISKQLQDEFDEL